jgi:pantetheine-phosphate adenylyltransferase
MSATPFSGQRAVYAGSFDPVTYGHLDIIRRGAALYPELTVAVGDNPRKKYVFSAEERRRMVEESLSDLPGVKVIRFSGLLIDLARSAGAKVILRGLRATTDFEYEFQLGLANRDLCPEIETVFLLTGAANIFISSSTAKEIAMGGGPVDRYVPKPVGRRLYQTFNVTPPPGYEE